MGQVYQATDTKLNRQVALKIIAEHRRDTRPAPGCEPVRCGAPRRQASYAPCRSTGRLANGHRLWHQGPQAMTSP